MVRWLCQTDSGEFVVAKNYTMKQLLLTAYLHKRCVCLANTTTSERYNESEVLHFTASLNRKRDLDALYDDYDDLILGSVSTIKANAFGKPRRLASFSNSSANNN